MGASGGYTFYDLDETAKAINDSGLSKGVPPLESLVFSSPLCGSLRF